MKLNATEVRIVKAVRAHHRQCLAEKLRYPTFVFSYVPPPSKRDRLLVSVKATPSE